MAGPIERPQNLIHQFKEEHTFNYDNVISGLRLMMWGIFKKVVIADRLAKFVDPVYTNPSYFPAITLLNAALFFTIEVYCDFSGYSDVAIGAARVMGFTLMKNFNFPFIAQNISELWRRWHISLSTWINDYLFTPLIIFFRNYGTSGLILSINISFLLVGLWHGANWTFIVFGILQGLALTYDMLSKKLRKKLSSRLPVSIYTSIGITLTFIYFMISCVFFRAKDLGQAFYFVHRLPQSVTDLWHAVKTHSLNTKTYLWEGLNWLSVLHL